MKKRWRAKTGTCIFGKNVRLCLPFLLLTILCLSFWSIDDISAAEAELTEITLLPVQDSYIQHDYPYFDPFHHPSCYNYGGSPRLVTASDAQSNHPRILVQFDLSPIPQDAIIASANLRLYCFSGGTWKSIGCYRLTQSWVEGSMKQMWDPPQEIADGCTWNTHDGTNNWATPGGDYASSLLDEVFIANDSDVGWKTWKVTSAVEVWNNGASSNYGFILTTLGYANYWGASFYSKEYSNPFYWPRLEVIYEIPEPLPPEQPLVKNISATPQVFDPYEKDSQVDISYELKEEASVQIEIYNAGGEKVKALFEDLVDGEEVEKEEKQEAGSQTEQWCGVRDFEEMALLDGDKGVLLAPDGEYTVKVSATSELTGRVESAEVKVVVKSD